MPNPCFVGDPGERDRSLLVVEVAAGLEGDKLAFALSPFRRFSKWSSAGVEMADRDEIKEDMTSGEAGCVLTRPRRGCAWSIEELVGLELGRCAIETGRREVRAGTADDEDAGLSMLIPC